MPTGCAQFAVVSNRTVARAAGPEELIEIQTSSYLEFVDLTERLQDLVASADVQNGMLLVQSLHTTAAIVVNESEPLLMEDLRETLNRVAPRLANYRHDDFEIRTANMTPEERPNGHSHCKALFLPTSVTLGVSGGRLLLGRWQRIFLVELDGGRSRKVATVLVG